MTLHLFEGFGVELEYMVVDRDTLNVRPVVDRILERAAGRPVSDFEDGRISWANELVKHVMEIRNEHPDPSLDGMGAVFQESVLKANKFASEDNTRLMPGSMHPWMDPAKEALLWDREYAHFYRTFDKIFDCRRHGWANIQSCQLNLPFGNDEEFGRLHAAIRAILPLIPALASSSPFYEGKHGPSANNRLLFYLSNAEKIPQVTGSCIPEPAWTPQEYQTNILDPLYQAIRPEDSEQMLQDEWLNARGAIARFQRNAIEIRLMDMQECPAMDIAVCRAVAGAVRALTEEKWESQNTLRSLTTDQLFTHLKEGIRLGEEAIIQDENYLRVLGMKPGRVQMTDIWGHLADTLRTEDTDAQNDWQKITFILSQGTLGRRLEKAAGGPFPSHEKLKEIYKALADSLAKGEAFA